MKSGPLARIVVLFAVTSTAQADPFPSRRGVSGVLDVPDAELVRRGALEFGGELRLADGREVAEAVQPSPLVLVAGLGYRLEAGLSLREGGLPGDPRPSPLLFAGSLKLGLWRPFGFVPGVALDASVDRMNLDPRTGVRLAMSTRRIGGLRLAGYVGAESIAEGAVDFGPTGGVAASYRRDRWEGVAATIGGDEGLLLSAALRFIPRATVGLSFGLSWLPGEGAMAVSVGLGYSLLPPTPRGSRTGDGATREEEEEEPEEAKAPRRRTFATATPRFRLRVKPSRGPGEDSGRHLQHGPSGPLVASIDNTASRPTGPTEEPEDTAPAAPAVDVQECGCEETTRAVLDTLTIALEDGQKKLTPAQRKALEAFAQRAGADHRYLVISAAAPTDRGLARIAKLAAAARSQAKQAGSLPNAQVVVELSSRRPRRPELVVVLLGEPCPGSDEAFAPPPGGGMAMPADWTIWDCGCKPVRRLIVDSVTVRLAKPKAKLTRPDREALAKLAERAAANDLQLLVVVAASNTRDLVAATRRAAALKKQLVAAGPLAPDRVSVEVAGLPARQGLEVTVYLLGTPAPRREVPR